MSSVRILTVAALFAALVFAGCDREEEPVPSAGTAEEVTYAKELDDVAAERKRLMTALREAQENGDTGKVAAVTEAFNENRKRAAAAVREHLDAKSPPPKSSEGT